MDSVDLQTVVLYMTKRNIQLRDDRDRMERQLVAAERLYEAVKQHSESTDVPDYLDNAITDYANAKGEK